MVVSLSSMPPYRVAGDTGDSTRRGPGDAVFIGSSGVNSTCRRAAMVNARSELLLLKAHRRGPNQRTCASHRRESSHVMCSFRIDCILVFTSNQVSSQQISYGCTPTLPEVPEVKVKLEKLPHWPLLFTKMVPLN